MEKPKYEIVLAEVNGKLAIREQEIENEIFELEKKKILLSIVKENIDRYNYNSNSLDEVDFYAILGVTKEEIADYDTVYGKINVQIQNQSQILKVLKSLNSRLQ